MNETLELARELVRLLEEKESCGCKKVELSTLEPGEEFKIADYNFVVLEQKEEQTVVISKGFMAEDVMFDENTRDYNKSNFKKVIDTAILPIIEKEVGAENIIEHEVELTSVNMQNEFGKFKCKVRPITFDEARKYNDLIVNEDLDGWWWTCTPWSTAKRNWEYSIAVVSSSGYFGYGDYDSDGGVRPVCILKSNIFVSKGE